MVGDAGCITSPPAQTLTANITTISILDYIHYQIDFRSIAYEATLLMATDEVRRKGSEFLGLNYVVEG